jgi:hypothetical protein
MVTAELALVQVFTGKTRTHCPKGLGLVPDLVTASHCA